MAGKEFPSEPILARETGPFLTHRFWVDLVHEAHVNGLTTYVSAGLEPQHMPRADYCGLDGLGIGIKLHYYDHETRRMGELKADEMVRVLRTAEKARATAPGRAAKLLARLGRIEFELAAYYRMGPPDD